MKKTLKALGWGALVVVVAALGAYAWAYDVAMGYYETHWSAHNAAFPIPFPLTDEEKAALGTQRRATGVAPGDPLAGVDLQGVALERAIARGDHLVHARVACNGCHADDFGGAVLLDNPLIGYFAAPNLTAGQGSVTKGYTTSDWDHAVRHGIRHNLETSAMPSNEFVNLSDRELSDIVAYIQSRPPVDRTIGPVKLGPVFAFAAALDRDNNFLAFTIDHQKPHVREPPPEAPTVDLGRHIAQACSTCHGATFSGGKLAADPTMPEVANLTPHETGLKGWTEADFVRALREGRHKDGTPMADQMPWRAYGRMNEIELKALWAFLQTLPPKEKGNH